jgi:hypothetical protein
MSDYNPPPPVTREDYEAGAKLNNYTNKVVNEDGTYVKIITHTERIEKIPQPLTPEERAEQRKQERIGLAIVGGIVVSFLGIVGWGIWQEEKTNRESPQLRSVPDLPEDTRPEPVS